MTRHTNPTRRSQPKGGGSPRRWPFPGYPGSLGSPGSTVAAVAAGAAITLAALIAYAPALSAGTIWDDADYLTENANLRDFSGLLRIWTEPRSSPQYYPAVYTTFWIEHQLWGLRPSGYHLTNVLLHATAAVLLWRVLRWLDVPGALAAGWLFALHPVAVESVAWITERKNVLSGVFYLGAALVYLRAMPRDFSRPPSRRGVALALLLFLAALLSKTVTATLPAALVLILWWKRRRLSRADLLALMPMCIAGAALAGLTAWLERIHVGACGVEWSWTFLDRLLIASRAVWFYFASLLWPVNLSFIYPKWTIDPTDWRQWMFPLALLVAIALLAIFRRRIGRGALTAALIYLGTLAPALGFVNVYPMRYSFVADHFQYHASMAMIGALAAGMALAWRRWAGGAAVAGPIALSPLLAILGVLTFNQARIYHDSQSLWRATVRHNPRSWMVHVNLGHALAAKMEQAHREGRGDQAASLKAQAKAEYRRALELAPELAETHGEVGVSLLDDGEVDAAIEQFRIATERDAAMNPQPRLPDAFNSWGSALLEQGRTEAAIEKFRRAIEINPGYATAHYNLAVALERLGRTAEAAEHYRAALVIQPGNAPAHHNLANLLRDSGKLDEAIAHYQAAIAQAPRSGAIRANYAGALWRAARFERAIEQYSRAAKLDPALRPGIEQFLAHHGRALPP